ncbi:SPRY domain protein [Burkholderia cepacia]|uniref:SPRY domain protein n=1 Tax=Burkholderia cepacia TaxID=292 RepID=UPI00264AA43F|nr:SPRY domain protein [Burkholderia cepacia]MDN7611269.1 SPRY domain protein [Burkholderia cepacia]
MADLKMNQFLDGQLADNQMLVGYDPYASANGERKYSAVNLVSYLTGALPFIGNYNPTINGILTMTGDIHFSGGGIVTTQGDVYQVGRQRWLSQDMAKLDDAWNKANATQGAADQAAASAAAAAASASGAAAASTTAATAATTASTAATTATQASTLAQAWAAQPSGTVNGTPNYSALYYASQSQYWAGISQAVNASPSTFNPGYKAPSITLQDGNLTAVFGGSTQAVVLATNGYASGKHYFEIVFSAGSSSGNASVGIAPGNEPLDRQVGYDDTTGAVAVFQSSGTIYKGGTNVGSVAGFSTANNTVGIAVDADQKLVWFRSSNGNWNGSASANPSTGTGGISYAITGNAFPAVCTDASATFKALFSGNFVGTIPAGFRAWAADSYHYVVPYATARTPGIVQAGPGLTVDNNGVMSADTYYDMVALQVNSTINIDLSNPVPGYHLILNSASATFALSNLNLPASKALRLTFYIEQGTGNNTISSWDSRIKWVGAAPVLAFAAGARNVIELETIDGQTFAGYYIGQIN